MSTVTRMVTGMVTVLPRPRVGKVTKVTKVRIPVLGLKTPVSR